VNIFCIFLCFWFIVSFHFCLIQCREEFQLFYWLKLALCPKTWSILVQVSRVAEKNTYYATAEWNILQMSAKSIWSILLLNSEVFCWVFLFECLLIGESGILKSLTFIIYGGFICPVSSPPLWWFWSLNSGLCAYEASAVVLEPWLQPSLTWLFLPRPVYTTALQFYTSHLSWDDRNMPLHPAFYIEMCFCDCFT
jgi:hypothetical protein